MLVFRSCRSSVRCSATDLHLVWLDWSMARCVSVDGIGVLLSTAIFEHCPGQVSLGQAQGREHAVGLDAVRRLFNPLDYRVFSKAFHSCSQAVKT
jgi:hypothetical protein